MSFQENLLQELEHIKHKADKDCSLSEDDMIILLVTALLEEGEK